MSRAKGEDFKAFLAVGGSSSAWADSFNPVAFIERNLLMIGDPARFDSMATSELRKLALGYGLKGLVLTHLLSAHQEKEASDAFVSADRVEKTVADVEAKGKLLEEIEGLKRAKEDEVAKFKKEKDEALAKARTDHAVKVDMLKKKHAEEKALLEREHNAVIVSLAQARRDMLALQEYADKLKENMANSYVDGFRFAIDQVKVLFPNIDQGILAQADVMKKIEDGKLISRIPEAK